MQRYKTKTGIILSEICGEYVLIAAKSLLKECPFVTVINESAAVMWKAMINGAGKTDLKKALKEEYEIEDEELLEQAIQEFVGQMIKLHYLEVTKEEAKE